MTEPVYFRRWPPFADGEPQVTLADKLRPYVDAIKDDASRGNKKASQVISLYQMHRRCPADPGASALCSAAFDEWLRSQK